MLIIFTQQKSQLSLPNKKMLNYEEKKTNLKFKLVKKNEEVCEDSVIASLKQDYYGEVVRVSQQDVSLVIKMLKITQAKDKPELEEKAWLEMKACYSFKIYPDPYVVAYRDIWESPLYYCMSMEWCDSYSLKEEMQNDGIANSRPELCVLYLLSILYALTACHERGIQMHRDLKPENILITHNLMQKCLKLADFGTCSYIKVAKGFEGTNLYLAPQVWAFKHQKLKYEFIRNNGYFSNCDIWSLGIILYQLYNGLHRNYGCIQFPFVEDIYHPTGNNKNFNKKLRSFYEKIIQLENGVERELLTFRKWANLSQKNKKRMECLNELIQKMLEPHPLRRCNFRGLYQYIDKNRSRLFADLEQTSIVRDFDKYYKAQKSVEMNQNNLMSTVLLT